MSKHVRDLDEYLKGIVRWHIELLKVKEVGVTTCIVSVVIFLLYVILVAIPAFESSLLLGILSLASYAIVIYAILWFVLGAFALFTLIIDAVVFVARLIVQWAYDERKAKDEEDYQEYIETETEEFSMEDFDGYMAEESIRQLSGNQ